MSLLSHGERPPQHKQSYIPHAPESVESVELDWALRLTRVDLALQSLDLPLNWDLFVQRVPSMHVRVRVWPLI